MKRKRSTGGGSNWMDTYGDMVTLLLCFFVMLYSMSNMSDSKWSEFVRSLKPETVMKLAEELGQDEDDPEVPPTEETLESALEALFNALSDYVAESGGAAQGIEAVRGDGYVFLSFQEGVFFDGDSYVLRPDGERVLAAVADILNHAKDFIDEVRIMGHTAQANPNRPNNVMADRFLASNRATIATVYLQEHCTLDPARLVSVGYGQHRPTDSNATEDERKHNRRVEMVITGLDVSSHLGDSIAQYFSMRTGEADG